MTKVVIDRRFGPQGFSTAALKRLNELGIPDGDRWLWRDLNRTDPRLIQVVEELGAEASGRHSKLIIVDVPDGVEWEIEDYDGSEHVAEVHRTWP
jgi:hypothetical protein